MCQAARTAPIIAQTGFDERVSSMSGLYGAGTYFAEDACKSNQYSSDANSFGERVIIYARVLVGDAYHTRTALREIRRPPVRPNFVLSSSSADGDAKAGGDTYDSVIAGPGVGSAQVHKEFIVYDHTQIYPEFIVYYKTCLEPSTVGP